MPNKLNQKVAPATTPVSRNEAKIHLNIALTDTTWDDYIDVLLQAATDWAEEYTRRVLITQTWELFLDEFPDDNSAIELPKPPLQSITSIKFIDENEDEQTADLDDFDTDIRREPGTVGPKDGNFYDETNTEPNAVIIEFIAGYGNASTDVPDLLIHGIKLMISHLFENREMTSTIGTPSQVPFPDGISRLLDQFAIREFV